MKRYTIKTINKVAGGFVAGLKTGVFDNVDVFDYSSYYPTTTITYNISPETIINEEFAKQNNIPHITIPEDYHHVDNHLYEKKYFRKDIKGVLPRKLEEFLQMRYKKKYEKFKYIESDKELYKKLDMEEKALKILLNSAYGIFGYKSSRFYNPIIANAITQHCRHLTKKCIEVAEKNGFTAIFSDTDSVGLLNIEKKIDATDLNNIFKNYIDVFVKQCGVDENKYMNLEYEKTFERLLYLKMKNYASLSYLRDENGNIVGEPQISITGLECKKKDTSPLGKEWQYKLVVDCYLLNKINVDEYIQQLREFKEEFKNGNIDVEYLVMAKTLTKHPKQYEGYVIDSKTGEPKKKKDGTLQKKSIPAHVKLVERLIEEGYDINVGDLIKYVVKKSKPRIEAITVDEYEKTKQFDRSYYWERCIMPVLKVLFVIDKDVVYNNADLWFMKQTKNNIKKLNTIEKKFDRS